MEAINLLKSIKPRWSAVSVLLFSVLFIPYPVFARDLTITLNPNQESDLAGYNLYYGTATKDYNPSRDYWADEYSIDGGATWSMVESMPISITLSVLPDPAHPRIMLKGLVDTQDYFLAVTAFDNESPQQESDYSEEVYLPSTDSEADPSLDADGDGVPDSLDAYPNDPSIATPRTATETGSFTIQIVSPSTATLSNVVTVLAESASLSQTDKPSAYQFPDGLISFQVNGLEPGQTVLVEVTFPTAFTAGAIYYKVDSEGFYPFDDAVFFGQTVTLTLTDGGIGDLDTLENGTITDPGGVAVPSESDDGSTPSGGGGGGGGGGCFITGSNLDL